MARKDAKHPQDYTVSDVQCILQVGKNTVRKLINTGQLEAYRIGYGGFRVTPQALEKFKQERIVKVKK